jgi:hypothetical protein
MHYKLYSLFFWQFLNYENTVHSGALSPGVKWPEHEAHHSSPSNAEVKNVCPNIKQRKKCISYKVSMTM